MVTHHLLDALAVVPHLPQRAHLRVLDVGSGGGVPGIPLAIVRPDWHVACVDSNHKKIAFVTQAAIELQLSNVEAHATRVEDYRARRAVRRRDLARVLRSRVVRAVVGAPRRARTACSPR